jgi:hypothetical protein
MHKQAKLNDRPEGRPHRRTSNPHLGVSGEQLQVFLSIYAISDSRDTTAHILEVVCVLYQLADYGVIAYFSPEACSLCLPSKTTKMHK